jgi:hypothetical protein
MGYLRAHPAAYPEPRRRQGVAVRDVRFRKEDTPAKQDNLGGEDAADVQHFLGEEGSFLPVTLSIMTLPDSRETG